MNSASSASTVAPTASGERVLTIDILRGFALLGILLVNMEMFNTSVYDMLLGNHIIHNSLDQIARWGVMLLAEGKFYSIFSFLFGLGMAIFMERTLAKGVRFGPLWLRRMGALFLFGLAHALLFWVGDILMLYSVLGFVIFLFFRKRKPRTLVIWAGIALAVPLVINFALFALLTLVQMTTDGAQVTTGFIEQERIWGDAAVVNNVIYATGSFADITAVRIEETRAMLSVWPFMAFNVLATMLLGFAAGKAGWHLEIANRAPTLRKLMWWGLVIGLLGNLAYVIGMEDASRVTVTARSLLATTGQTLGAPALAIFYMAGLTLLLQRPQWKARLAPVASAGRMAFTNYLTQSLICTLLFYSYGFGLYGMGVAAGVALTCAIWLLQVVWSVWWLNRFRFGPVEWLWRVVTYWKGQPMRKTTGRITAAPAAS